MLGPAKLIPLVVPVLDGNSYSSRVRRVAPANLIAYWPLWEASGSAAKDISGNGFNGAYTGVTLGQGGIGDGRTCPLFDGVNDFVDIYSTGFRDAFDGSEGSVIWWSKVSGVGVWTDGANRRCVQLYADVNNAIQIYKSSTNNRVWAIYAAGGTSEYLSRDGVSDVGWVAWGYTWSAIADEVRLFYNGSQSGATQTALGTWVGNLASADAVIGARNTTPNEVWDGYLAHCAVWDTPLTPTQIAALAAV